MTTVGSVRDGGVMRPVVYARRRRGGAAAEDWAGRWVCAGLAEQLEHPGDVLPVTVSGHACHVRRGDRGKLVAALNARPFGGCMSIPVQCSGARRIRCPHLACTFSENPGVLGERTDPDGRARRQFVGVDPRRLVPVPLARCGPLLFVHVPARPAQPLAAALAPLRAAWGPVALEHFRATDLAEHKLKIGWRGGASVVTALAGRLGVGDPRAQTLTDDLVTLVPPLPAGDGCLFSTRFTGWLIWPHLVLAQLPDRALFALLRPTGPGTCSVLSAVLRPPGGGASGGTGEISGDVWRAVLASTADA